MKTKAKEVSMPEEEKGYTKPEDRLVGVKTVVKGDKMTLVEYFVDDEPIRVSVPTKELKQGVIDGQVTGVIKAGVLSKGLAYGIPYEQLNYPKLTGKDIAKIFRNHNLWTAADLRTKPHELQAAFSDVYGSTLKTIFNYIKDK